VGINEQVREREDAHRQAGLTDPQQLSLKRTR
jgi:hypothetical protein